MLLHPAGYGLTDHAELASNLRLVLASLPEPNGLKATFLQGIKIASYSGRVSHARLDAANPEKYLYIMRDSIDHCRDAATVGAVNISARSVSVVPILL